MSKNKYGSGELAFEHLSDGLHRTLYRLELRKGAYEITRFYNDPNDLEKLLAGITDNPTLEFVRLQRFKMDMIIDDFASAQTASASWAR